MEVEYFEYTNFGMWKNLVSVITCLCLAYQAIGGVADHTRLK